MSICNQTVRDGNWDKACGEEMKIVLRDVEEWIVMERDFIVQLSGTEVLI